MENSSNPLDVFCGCLVCLILPVVFVILKSYMGSRANLSLLFGFGTINAEQPVHVGKTSFLGFVAAAVSLVFSLIIFGAVQSFSQMPLTMGLILFACAAILVVTFRYLQLAIQLDRQGTSQPAQLDNVLSKTASDGEGGNIIRTHIKYSYANGIKNEIPLDIRIAQVIQRKAANLRVVYLDDRPLIHRTEWEILQETKPAFAQHDISSEQDWRSKVPNSGLAQDLIPRALAEFVRVAPTGGFITFSDKATGVYVQFLMLGDALLLDYAISTKVKETDDIIRLHRFFAEHNVKAEMESSKTQVYRMDFPPTPDQVEKASRVALDIFEQVFLLNGMSPLEAKVDA